LDDVPSVGNATSEDIEEPLLIGDVVYRGIQGVATMSNAYDLILDWQGELNEEEVGQLCRQGDAESLPDILKPKAVAPPGTVTQFVIQACAGVPGHYNILKHFIFKGSQSNRTVAAMCHGEPFCLPYKQNVWPLKKATQALLVRVPGYHVMYVQLTRKGAPAAPRDEKSQGWQPTPDQIKAGFAFIKTADIGSEPTDELEWIVTNIKDPGSAIHGWPMSLVEKAFAKKGKASTQAETTYEYPLLGFDFKDQIVEYGLPLVFATGTVKGNLMIGMPKRGKTVLATTNGMAMARMHVRVKGLARRPCTRRAKQFDCFHAKPGEVNESILVDDPTMHKFQIEDIMAYGDVGKAGHSDARFVPVKWAKNQYHSLLCNIWNKAAEEAIDAGEDVVVLTWEQFAAIIAPTFGPISETQMLAVLKRFNTFIAGTQGLVIRPASDDPRVPIYMFTADGLGDDWVKADHKSALNAFERDDEFVKYDGWDAEMKREQDFIDTVRATTKDMLPEEIVTWWVQRVESRPRRIRMIPATATQGLGNDNEDVAADPDGQYRFPVPRIQSGATRRSRFVFGSTGAASSSRNRPVTIKREPLDDESLARALAAQEEMAAGGTIEIPESPVKKQRADRVEYDLDPDEE
jgi:hypothetical protein